MKRANASLLGNASLGLHSASGNLFWGMQFRTCGKFRVFADSKSSLTPEIFHKYKSHTAITSIVVAFSHEFTESSLRGRIVDSHEAIHNKNKSCDSTQNKSFCFVWLSPKVESSLPYQSQSTSDFTITQNLVKNKSCDSTNRISPDSWCKKSESKGAVVPPADFLLESELRGTPPKSEKAVAFVEHNLNIWGERRREVQPFLRKEKGDSNDLRNIGDSRIDKMDCHDLTSSSLAMTGNYNAESAHDSTKSPSNDKFAKRIKKLLITASGGAFRDLPLSEIPTQCAKNALKHPNWAMGRKITIDSATMINKLFEILEAKWLFGVENIDAVIERNSTIHALIQTNDNAIIAHLSANDMRLPIASALLGAKAKNKSFIKELDLMNLCIHFERIDINRYPLWRLKDALLKCPKLGIIINAANDILVAKFLENEIRFGDISNGIFAILDRFGDESALNAISNIAEIADLHAKIADFFKSY